MVAGMIVFLVSSLVYGGGRSTDSVDSNRKMVRDDDRQPGHLASDKTALNLVTDQRGRNRA